MVSSKKTITEESLEKEIADRKNNLALLKRENAKVRLEEAIINIRSEDKKEQRELLDACYNYIAQHRALFKKGGFNQSGEWIE